MKRLIEIILFTCAITLFSGCGGVPPILHEGRQLDVFIRCNPNIQPGMKKDEIEDREKVAAYTVENISDKLSSNGCNVIASSAAETYTPGRGRHQLSITIRDLHIIPNAAQFWIGAAAGPSWVDYHYELTGESKASILSYDNHDGSIHGWESCVDQLNAKAAERVMAQLRAIYGSPTGRR